MGQIFDERYEDQELKDNLKYTDELSWIMNDFDYPLSVVKRCSQKDRERFLDELDTLRKEVESTVSKFKEALGSG